MPDPIDFRQLQPAHADLFHRDGFIWISQVFTPAEMDEIDAAFERLHDLAVAVSTQPREGHNLVHQGSAFTFAPSNAVRHIAYCGNAEPTLLRFGRDERLLAIAALLLGSTEMDHLINQAHYKKPGSAVTFDWHQDSQHRGVAAGHFTDVNGQGSYVQIALAVDAATPVNGPLEFIRGSHKLGHLGPDLPNKLDLTQRVAPLLQRGDVAAFGPFTIHGSQANLSNHSRRVFINGFAYPGANKKDYRLPGSGQRLRLQL